MTTQTVPIITKKMLRGACKEQKKIFKAEWPDGAEATLGNVLRAVELGLNLEWGRRLFSPTALAEYEQQVTPFWDEYDRQVAPLWAEYERQVAPHWEGYQRQVALLWDEYEQQEAPNWTEYHRRIAPLWAEYNRQIVALWAEYERQEDALWAEHQRQKAPIWLAAFLASHGGMDRNGPHSLAVDVPVGDRGGDHL